MSPRILHACPECHRQYEVSALQHGESVRCRCGRVFLVRHREPRAARMLRCSACGAALRDGARSCDYCSAEATLEERRLDSLCPECCARMSSDARYCMSCGVEIAPQAVEEIVQGARCPRCQAQLRSRSVELLRVLECRRCGGLWLEPGVLEELCERVENDPLMSTLLSGVPDPHPEFRPSDAVYLPCTRCEDMMVPRNFGGNSGVVFDLCQEHGVWLDHSELEHILRFTRAGGLVAARRREVARLERDERDRRRRLAPPPPTHREMGPQVPLFEQSPVLHTTLRFLSNLFA